jgi:hypothetical protein
VVWGVYVLLPWVERPCWCFQSECVVSSELLFSGIKFINAYSTLTLELFCVMVFLGQMVLQYYSGHWTAWNFFRSSPWRIVRALLLFISLMDVLVSLASPKDGFRLSFILRPLIVVSLSIRVRQIVSSLLAVLPKVLDVLVLTLLLVLFYGCMGLFIFRDFGLGLDA